MTDVRKTLAALRRKLERLELEALRQHAAELHARLEQAEARAARAEDLAEHWWSSCMELQEAFDDESQASGRCIGLTQSGELRVVRTDAH